MLSSINTSYAYLEEHGEQNSIRVYSTPNKAGTLIAPMASKIEYLQIEPAHRKLALVHRDKEYQEIKPWNQPSSFPWHLAFDLEKMKTFIDSQSFHVKKLDNGEYKLNMHTAGKGGILPIIPIVAGVTAVAMITASTVGVFQTGTNDIQKQAKVRAQQAEEEKNKKSKRK